MAKSPYEVLGIKQGATPAEIKKAYRDLVKQYHPDNYKDHPLETLAKEKMQEINEAYDQVTNANNPQNTRPTGNSQQYGQQTAQSQQQQQWQQWQQGQRNGPYYQQGGSNGADMCNTLSCCCCADTCCECMGGDICGCC